MRSVAPAAPRDPVEPAMPALGFPAPLTRLIAWGTEVAAAGEALRRARLVTLTGPAGVGKTRLAMELVTRLRPQPGDGGWLVDLATVPPSTDVVAETARTLSVHIHDAATAVDRLCRYLAPREAVLVLDNCEHVLDACAGLAAALLGRCRDLRILATSREPFGIAGETVWSVDPLGPDDASRLFVERARQRRPEFVPGGEDQRAIEQMCARLDGLPLAIELAAARVGMMSVAEILASIEAGRPPAGNRRMAPAHHRSVRAAVDWSYQLLEPAEQLAFRSLAVFVGGFDAGAAQSVAPEMSVDVLARLVDKSLVTVARSGRDRTRYRLLETVRDYASERLVESGQADLARSRLVRHYTAAGNDDFAHWPSRNAQQVVADLEDDYANVRAALEWATTADPAGAALLLAQTKDLFIMLGHADGRRLAELVLDAYPVRDRVRAVVQIAAGLWAMLLFEPGAGQRALAEAHRLSVELGDQPLQAWASFFKGLADVYDGALDRGREHLEAARSGFRALGLPMGQARATAALGLASLMADELDDAAPLVEEALTLSETLDDRWGQGECHTYLGIIEESTDRSGERSSSHYRQAVELLRPFRDAALLPVSIAGQASVLARRDPARSLALAAAASAMRDRVGSAPFFRARAVQTEAAAEAALGGGAERIRRDGARLDTDAAIALAFDARGSTRAGAAGGLSERELEVAALVAEGLANKMIAARLHLSVRTVESHVRHVLTKLDLAN
ncbi:MAG TPA: LuxR C-terminal-related transcriptional regulator, partial [Gemmatimonadales bacterium]|nr:LuxR C-terminal-related transcriptional regulator [Gemmatimonadales bacterium]